MFDPTLLNVDCSDTDIRVTPSTMHMLTIAAIKAYSIEVAPLSVARNLAMTGLSIPNISANRCIPTSVRVMLAPRP
jgi:hypothetical protein